MTDRSYDLIVLGGGSGGLAAAKRAASHGAKVAIVESGRVGGTCVIRGCVPKKLMVYASHAGEWIALARDLGWNVAEETELSWERLCAMRNGVVDRLEKAHEGHLERAGVELIRGRGRLSGTHELTVGDERYTFEKLIVATGATPVMPSIEGDGSSMTSDALFALTEKPRTAAVIGGGYIAVEYAGILNSLGTQVTMLVRDQLLRGFDRQIVDFLEESMAAQGIEVLKPASVHDVVHDERGYCVHYDYEGDRRELDVDASVVFAIGRIPNTEGLGLTENGIELDDNGAVKVDQLHRTSKGHIFAVGDVIDKANLTPVAIKAGRSVADREFGGLETHMDYECIPTAVFSYPEIGTVGLTEDEARAKYQDVEVYQARFNPMVFSGTPSERKIPALTKMIVEGPDERVVGLHICGLQGAEIIQGFAVAVKAGLTKAQFDATVAIHPTTAEEFVLLR